MITEAHLMPQPFRIRARYKNDDAQVFMTTSVKIRILPVYVTPGTCEHYTQIPVAALANLIVHSRFLKWGTAGDRRQKEIYDPGEIVWLEFKKSDLRRPKRVR